MKWIENRMEIKKIVRGECKRDTEKEGKKSYFKGKIVFHSSENNFTHKENDFIIICKPNNVKFKIEENNFPWKYK